MGTVEQDLSRYQGEVDRASDEQLAGELAADELREEISQDVDDLETLLCEVVENGDFPFATLAKMLTLQSHTDDSRDFIRQLRAGLEPRIQEMVTSRIPARLKSWRDHADELRAEARLESRDANLGHALLA